MRNRWLCIVPLVLAPLLSGCVWVAATGVVAGVSAARQERTIGNAVDDMRIKTELSSSLVQQSVDNFVNVSSTVVEGRVLLTGRVSSPEARLDASRIAWSVEGVRKVDNDIAVTEDGQWLNRPMDIYIRTKLAADLLTDADIRDVNYTIDVVNGVVYLMGVGQDQAEIDRAVADARAIPQVKRVENYVVLKTDPIRYGMAASAQPRAPAPAPRAARAAEPPDAGDDADDGDDTDDSDPGDSDGDSSGATRAPTPLTH